MPDVRLARTLLEIAIMKYNLAPTQVIEPMIDANQAASALRLPYYWFADRTMRSRYRIPHYLMGGLVRYRLSELACWAACSAPVQRRQTGGAADACGEGDE